MIALSFRGIARALIYSDNIFTRKQQFFWNVVLVLFKDGYIHETQKLQTSDVSMGHVPITDMITYAYRFQAVVGKMPDGSIEGFFREDDVSSCPFNGGFSPHILFIDGYYRGDERQLSSQSMARLLHIFFLSRADLVKWRIAESICKKHIKCVQLFTSKRWCCAGKWIFDIKTWVWVIKVLQTSGPKHHFENQTSWNVLLKN